MAEERIIILGAGSQASVVLDVLQSAGHADRVEGFIDYCDQGALVGSERDDLPVVGTLAELPDLYARGVRLAALAAGSPLMREKLLQQALNIGFGLISVIHPSAVIGSRVQLGRAVNICANAVIATGCHVGQGCIVNTGATIDHHGQIGDFSLIGPGVHVGGNVTVGDYAWLGIGCSVIQGVSIGSASYIGAGAAVVEDIPPRVLAFGVPARVQRPYDLSECDL